MTISSPVRAGRGARPRVDGKFLEADGRRFLVKGVAYGTFAPDAHGVQFPAADRVRDDFAAMAAAGCNTIRTYTPPPVHLLDAAAQHGLRAMVGLPWPQHVAFLDDGALVRRIRRDAVTTVRALASHEAALLFAVGSEIPAAVVRWHGPERVERFLRELYDAIKSAAPESLLTYVNFPPTEYLALECFDVCASNVYLHHETDLRAYLARLQHVAGPKPLLLAEAGADSRREGCDGQARITAMHVRAAFAEGACGAIAFSWTDEWWRGGHPVEDWAFGLVDADRRPKPALRSAADAFGDAPFPAAARATWPTVSVVVCAYNAADTIDDCLTSLAALTYPAVEIIVVNDGSRDETSAIARRHGVKVIDISNGGLSAARNVGLAEAGGEIVAYTDADVRVDPDWLTYLVQPLLPGAVRLKPDTTNDTVPLKPDATNDTVPLKPDATRDHDVVGVGGPNVVPHDDPWLAQCVARAPGGPTHVLLDDRIAEHVPGCNMAFRRDALLAIGGFNPVYLRAGDDVDVCWRLQAQGLRIGFAGAALVWHHHRTTIEAFWRQQVGYGEGEAWLNVHHPEKFSGGEMLWRGHIYSPLPFVQALFHRRVNTGVWGTAAFPSVYSTSAYPLRFLPHSAAWMAACATLIVSGALALPSRPTAAWWLLAVGALGLATTIARCAACARRSDLRALAPIGRLSARQSRLLYRSTIALLHLVQPLARMQGRIRGMWSLPQVSPEHAARPPQPAALPSLRHVGASARLLAGALIRRSFWSESWVSNTALLSELAGMLRVSRPAHVIELDDGWHADRDVSVAIGHWGWLHARVLVEEHAQGRCLWRIGTSLGSSAAGIVLGLAAAALVVAASSASVALRSPALGVLSLMAATACLARGLWQTTRAVAVLEGALGAVAADAGMAPMPESAANEPRKPRMVRRWAPWQAPDRPRLSPRHALRAVQTIVIAALAGVAGVGALTVARHTAVAPDSGGLNAHVAPTGGVAVGVAGDVFVADAEDRIIRRLRPRPPLDAAWTAADIGSDGHPLLGHDVPFDGAADIALAPDGNLYVADAQQNRIALVARSTGEIVSVSGSSAAGFAGDGRKAHAATLAAPSAIAVARNGDVYVADTLNHRIRRIARATGIITTIAGDGTEGRSGAQGEFDDLGDGRLAVRAHLSRPMGLAVAPNGDIYVADTGHHRVRRISGRSGVITTVAGDGTAGDAGDRGPAARAQLAGPMGLALEARGERVILYVADALNHRVRMVTPDGVIATLTSGTPLLAPTRLAYHPAGWLYVKDGSPDGVTAIAVATLPRVEVAAAPQGARRKST